MKALLAKRWSIVLVLLQCSGLAYADIHSLPTSDGGKLTVQSGPGDTFTIVIQPRESQVHYCAQEAGRSAETPSSLLFCRISDNKTVKKITPESPPTSRAFVVEGETVKKFKTFRTSYSSLREFLSKSARSTEEVRGWLSKTD